jgi:hypothetical protein
MPSGKKDIYGNKSKALYKAGTIAAERAAIANRDPARARRAMEAVAREGTTSAAGGRAPVKMPKPVQKPVQVIRTTVSMKPTPAKKK